MVAPLYPLSETEGRKKGSQIAETDTGVRCALDNPPVNRFAHPSIMRESVLLRVLYSLIPGSPIRQWNAKGRSRPASLLPGIRTGAVEGLQPSTPHRHEMNVPVEYGLRGWTWDQNGDRTAVPDLVNSSWIAVNALLRAMGLYGDPSMGSDPAGGSGPASGARMAA